MSWICSLFYDKTVSSIPCQADWPVSFPQQSPVELVSTWGLHPETIVSSLSKQLEHRIARVLISMRRLVLSGAITTPSQLNHLGQGETWSSKVLEILECYIPLKVYQY